MADLIRQSAAVLASAIAEREVSAVEVTQAHLDRIAAVNGRVNAITVVLGDEALRGAEVNEAKKILAFEATRMLHGEEAAGRAAETARQVFEQGVAGGELPAISRPRAELEAGIPLHRLVAEAGLAKSNSEARRLAEQGGVRLNDAPVSDPNRLVGLGDVGADGAIKLSAGRKRHALVRPA